MNLVDPQTVSERLPWSSIFQMRKPSQRGQAAPPGVWACREVPFWQGRSGKHALSHRWGVVAHVRGPPGSSGTLGSVVPRRRRRSRANGSHRCPASQGQEGGRGAGWACHLL